MVESVTHQAEHEFSVLMCSLTVVSVFSFIALSWCEVVFHCGFHLYFPNDQWCQASFHVLFIQFQISFKNCLFRSFAKVLIRLFVELQEFFIYSKFKPLTSLYVTDEYSFPFCGYFFIQILVCQHASNVIPKKPLLTQCHGCLELFYFQILHVGLQSTCFYSVYHIIYVFKSIFFT